MLERVTPIQVRWDLHRYSGVSPLTSKAQDSSELSSLDVAFLCMDRPGTPMHVGGLATFTTQEPVEAERVAELLRARAIRIPRLTQRVRHRLLPLGSAQWVIDPSFEPSWHIKSHRLPAPGDTAQLEHCASLAMSEPLDMRRPLWQVHVITGCADGGFAILVKLHHAVADGAAAMLLGLGLLDQGAQVGAENDVTGQDTGTKASGIERVLTAGIAAANALPSVVEQARESAGIAAAVLRGARWSAAPSCIPAPAGPSRRLVARALPLADVRQVRAHHGGTVNDVLLAVLAGAFRRWRQSTGRPVHGVSLRALIPVSRRSRVRAEAAGNQLSGYLCDLPIGAPDPKLRLRRVRLSMNANKSAGPLRGPGALPVLADRLPPMLHRLATPFASQGASLLFDTVITTVPGPPVPLSLAESPMSAIFPMVPLAEGHALNIALLTYQGQVNVGLYGDRLALPDLDVLADAIPYALRELCDLTPDGGVPEPRAPAPSETAKLIE